MTSPAPKPWEHAKSGGSEADPLAARFVESLSYDTRLYDADIRGSLAHARMLEASGLITPEDLAAIERGLAEIRREIESAPAGPTAVGVPGAWPGWRVELEDVHMCIEAALVEKVGDAGRRLHTARSRNDQVALDLRLWLRDAMQAAAAAADKVLESLESLAERQGDLVLPSYTHLQRAQPIALGGELMAWHAMLSRDRAEFLRLACASAAESPLGSGAVAGTSLPIRREQTAEALGFGGPSASAIDATASRDEALDALYAMSRCAMHLSRLAEQWILYCSTEFGFLTLAEAYTTGSSMMPQKRNPDMLELIRGRCGSVYGRLVSLLTICKGLPLAYNRDLQEDKRHLFAAYDTLMDSLAMTSRIVATATFHEVGGLDRGHLDATSLAEYLVNKGAPFRTAHQIVGSLVRRCDASGRHSLSQLTLEEINAAIAEAGVKGSRASRDVQEWLGAANVVRRYRSEGNAGRSGYREALARAIQARRARASEPEAETTRKSGPEAGPPPSLFGEPLVTGKDRHAQAAAEAERYASAYAAVGRTLDDLPYTEEFETLYRNLGAEEAGLTRRDVFHRLHNLRKAGKLPRAGRAATAPPRITPEEEAALRAMVESAVGTLGQRDQLPYTPKFDELVEAFNAMVGRQTDQHTVWRLVAKLAK